MSETAEQKEIVSWFREQYPQYAMCLRVSQTGGHIGKGKAAAIRNARSKAMGRVNGESDIAILIKSGVFGCLLIEHKANGSAYKPTDSQLAYLQHHADCGNCAVVTRGVDMAKLAIQQYMDEVPMK